MKKIVFIFFVFGVLSCKIYRERVIKFKPYKSDCEYSFLVPGGYQEKRILGDHEYQQEYWYSDSIVLYITTFRNTFNYEIMREQGVYYDRFEALNSGDTITLKGTNKTGLYWKDKLIENGITIGYSNVPSEKIGEFDKAVLSIKKIK